MRVERPPAVIVVDGGELSSGVQGKRASVQACKRARGGGRLYTQRLNERGSEEERERERESERQSFNGSTKKGRTEIFQQHEADAREIPE